MKNLLVAQSAGPISAINATLCGVVERGLIHTEIEKIYGAQNDALGILSDKELCLIYPFICKFF